MRIPILNGIYSTNEGDLAASYPVNYVPVPKSSGVSPGYLKPADGIAQFATGPGVDRGGINWNGICYRVMGSKLVTVSDAGSVATIGDVGNYNGSKVRFDYSFDRLAIASDGNLFYWDGVSLLQVTDADLGYVVDFVWVDGYFMTTDGQYLIVTELNDPFSVNPLKYGSSEADPDPIKSVRKLRNEIYALNRYTIEVFDNVGGELFPFSRIEGAQVMRGTVGTHACAVFMETIVFVGGGRNESVAVWIGANSTSTKISTRDIDKILNSYTEAQLSAISMDVRVDSGHQHLFIHLPDKTLVYDGSSSIVLGEPVWFIQTSSPSRTGVFRCRNIVYAYGKWLCGDTDSSNIGYLSDNVTTHWGNVYGWEFATQILYNDAMGAVFHKIELVCLSGRVEVGTNPIIETSYSIDGMEWSNPRELYAGKIGQRLKRLAWMKCGMMRRMRMQRFIGTSEANLTIVALDVVIEPLYA